MKLCLYKEFYTLESASLYFARNSMYYAPFNEPITDYSKIMKEYIRAKQAAMKDLCGDCLDNIEHKRCVVTCGCDQCPVKEWSLTFFNKLSSAKPLKGVYDLNEMSAE